MTYFTFPFPELILVLTLRWCKLILISCSQRPAAAIVWCWVCLELAPPYETCVDFVSWTSPANSVTCSIAFWSPQLFKTLLNRRCQHPLLPPPSIRRQEKNTILCLQWSPAVPILQLPVAMLRVVVFVKIGGRCFKETLLPTLLYQARGRCMTLEHQRKHPCVIYHL